MREKVASAKHIATSRRTLCQPSPITTLSLNLSATVKTAVRSHRVTAIIPHLPTIIMMTLTQSLATYGTSLFLRADTAMTLHLRLSRAGPDGISGNKTTTMRKTTTGGGLSEYTECLMQRYRRTLNSCRILQVEPSL